MNSISKHLRRTNLYAVLLSAPMIMAAASTNAASVNSVLQGLGGGNELFYTGDGVNKTYPDPNPADVAVTGKDRTEVQFFITAGGPKTAWLQMERSVFPGSADETFTFYFVAKDPTLALDPFTDPLYGTQPVSFDNVWIDIWKPGSTSALTGAPDPSIWAEPLLGHTSLLNKTSSVAYLSERVTSLTAGGDREVIKVSPGQSVQSGSRPYVKIDMTLNGNDTFNGLDPEWTGFHDDATFNDDYPYWYVGLTVLDPTQNDVLIGLDDGIPMTAAQAVPVPAAVWMFGSAMLSLIAVGRRRRA